MREQIRDGILGRLTWLEVGCYDITGNSDSLDAFIASLTAYAAFRGDTHLPGQDQEEAARIEDITTVTRYSPGIPIVF